MKPIQPIPFTNKKSKATTTKVKQTITSPDLSSIKPIQQTSTYVIASEWLDEEKNSYEVAIGKIEFDKGILKSSSIESYTIENYDKMINHHEQHKQLCENIKKEKNYFVYHRAPKSYLPYSAKSESPIKLWIENERKNLKKETQSMNEKIKIILFNFQKTYEIKRTCKHHVNDVFKCAYVDVEFMIEFLKHAINM